MTRALVRRPILIFIASSWLHLLLIIKFILQNLRNFVEMLVPGVANANRGIAQGKTVLVTSGRHAKTLHIVRALKSVGATVIVTDYQKFSSSSVSLACDKFLLLPQLQSSQVQQWVEYLLQVLVDNNVDLVLPVSTINEVLYVALAKQKLQSTLPHVQWFCPDLETCIQFDDRNRFSKVCEKYNIPVPENGSLVSSDEITELSKLFTHGIILKRIESSVNRAEEIVPIRPGCQCPTFVKPSEKDPWQWQEYIKGSEYSVWYVCVSGHVTLSACYKSAADLVNFDPAPVPADIDEPVRRMIRKLRLTGQYAFDFIREYETGRSYVIECNPRASSVLETISNTPLWGEAFFGIDVSHRTVHSRVGFLYHRNSWPFASRWEGYFSLKDPLPMLCAEIIWPLNAIAHMSEGTAWILDVNICKVITKGQSPGRDLNVFTAELEKYYLSQAAASLRHMDTVLIDVSIAGAVEFIALCKSFGLKVIPFYASGVGNAKNFEGLNVARLPSEKIENEFLEKHRQGETRILLGARLAGVHGSHRSISYRVVDRSWTWHEANEIPLRKLRAIHVMGSCTSGYYEDLSSYYGYGCINSIGLSTRFDHIVAYVHQSGLWSIESGKPLEFMKNKAERMTTEKALCKLVTLKPDVVVPHMFDYNGLTVYRGLFDILQVPLIGCASDALALSSNKIRTKACAAMAGVQTPKFEAIRKGGAPSIPIPFVVKPVEGDNSEGIELVRRNEHIVDAFDAAFKFGDEVICEEFIDLGRELRVGLIENGDGELEMLPVIEFALSAESPIRRPEDKLVTDEEGKITGLSSRARTCPADIDETLRSKLFTAAKRAHRALGCRDYSIYDFRVDNDGEVFMLETCLYCSFSPQSALVSMQSSLGTPKSQLFERLFERALTRRDGHDRNTQSVGMKKRR